MLLLNHATSTKLNAPERGPNERERPYGDDCILLMPCCCSVLCSPFMYSYGRMDMLRMRGGVCIRPLFPTLVFSIRC